MKRVLSNIKDPDLYVDPDFPHSNKSIGPGLDRQLRWIPARRLNEGEWDLFAVIEPNDILQGSIGDCWLVAALAVLAEFPPMVRRMFVRNGHRHSEKGVPNDGKYIVKLFDHGKGGFSEISLDEYVPYSLQTCEAAFTKPNGNELWVLMLEKAMAKLFGNYAALEKGNCSVAFRAFTGERDQRKWTRGDNETTWKESRLTEGGTTFAVCNGDVPKDGDTFFETLRQFYKNNYLMGAGVDGSSQNERKDGLVEGHVYSVLAVVSVDGTRLIKLRNCWGSEREWTGAWCDNDPIWKSKTKVKERLRPVFGPDGVFWISWEDFSRLFHHIHVSFMRMEGRAGAFAGEGAPSRRRSLEEQRAAAEGEIRRLFAAADANSDGILDPVELATIMEDLGMDGSNSQKLLQVVDKNKDGKVQTEEFLDWIFAGKGTKTKAALAIATQEGIRTQDLHEFEVAQGQV